MGNKSSLMLRDEEVKKLSDETGFSPTQIEKLYSRFAQLDRSNLGSLSKKDLMSIPELAINPLCDRLIQVFFSESADQGEDSRINFRQFVTVLAAFRSSSSTNQSIHKLNSHRHPTQIRDFNNSLHSSHTEIEDRIREPKVIRPYTKHHSYTDKIHNISRRDPDINGKLNKKPSLIPDPGISENLWDKLLFIFKIYDADNDDRISFRDLRNILRMMVGNYIDDVQLDKIATRAFVEVDQDSDGFIEFGEFCRVFAGKDLDDKLRVKFFN